MEPLLDLYGASREELIAVIVRQREHIAALEQCLARQEADLATLRATIQQLTERIGVLLAADDPGAGGGAHPHTMPGLKPAPRRPAAPTPRPPRKRRAHGSGRKRMPPTAVQHHAFAHCPQCRTPLRGGTLRRRREVIEVRPSPRGGDGASLVWSGAAHNVWDAVDPAWVLNSRSRRVLGQGRIGIGLASLIATLREARAAGRSPPRCSGTWPPCMGCASVSGRSWTCSPALAATGERQRGRRSSGRPSGQPRGAWGRDRVAERTAGNGYVWTFSTPSARYFQHPWGKRDKAMVQTKYWVRSRRGAGE